MKKLFANKASFIILFLFISTLAQGAVVVKQLRGNAFMIFDNKTQSLLVGDHAPSGAEILTEEGTELTLSNYYNHQFHITGSSHLKVDKKNTILFEGYLWFRSISKSQDSSQVFNIQTANGIIKYNEAEGIVSFDPHHRKTQFLGLRGSNTFFNKIHPTPRYEIKSGMFSFIDNNHKQGVPLRPTPIGLKSYKKLMVLFDGIRPLPSIQLPRDSKEPQRGLASVDEQNNFKDMLNKHSFKQDAPPPTGPSPIKINIYTPSSPKKIKDEVSQNMKIGKKSSPTINRAPASLSPQATNPFEQALQSRYKDKMRHDKEFNSLIDALKSVNQDYQKNY